MFAAPGNVAPGNGTVSKDFYAPAPLRVLCPAHLVDPIDGVSLGLRAQADWEMVHPRPPPHHHGLFLHVRFNKIISPTVSLHEAITSSQFSKVEGSYHTGHT